MNVVLLFVLWVSFVFLQLSAETIVLITAALEVVTAYCHRFY